jgi:AcrR family transcriptional regulator
MVKPNSLSGRKKKPAGPSPLPKSAPRKPKTPAASATEVRGEASATGETEKRILVAARKEFISKGLEGARMQAVATQAGVNKALLHYYYRSKERLYQKVLEDTLQTVWGKVAEEFRTRPQAEGLEPLLNTFVTTFVHTLAANPDFPLFMFREIASGGGAFRETLPPILKRFQDVPASIAGMLAAESKSGAIKPIPPIHFFINMMGMVSSTFLLMPMIRKLGSALGVESDFGGSFLEERIHSITDTLLNGIRIKR